MRDINELTKYKNRKIEKEMNKEYKEGFKDGFRIGIEESNKQANNDATWIDWYKRWSEPLIPNEPRPETCPKCGVRTNGPGGYVCTSINCPAYLE